MSWIVEYMLAKVVSVEDEVASTSSEGRLAVSWRLRAVLLVDLHTVVDE